MSKHFENDYPCTIVWESSSKNKELNDIIDIVSEHCEGWSNCERLSIKLYNHFYNG